ncbi:MAG: retropepsin-like domain-containing protein [Acidobacteria bacterium]|nr:retropepsin-like domain-containing protein [Acidobacteriota bacterium]
MSFRFNPQRGLIMVRAELIGASGSVNLRLALDTGATGTMINVGMLVSIGYDPSLSLNRTQVTTGSGVEYVPRIVISKIKVLGQELADFPVLCHTLPPSAGIDGLLGLDFLRGRRLEIDFRSGEVSLA